MRKTIFSWALFLASASVLAADGDDALLGFRWGMSIQDVRAVGSKLEKKEADRNLEIYEASTVPKPLSDFETYMLTFSDGKLVKVSVIGKDISGDPTGSNGKERFGALQHVLSEKYGKPKNYQTIGNKLYKDRDEFYECLKYSGCGVWASSFENKEKTIVLEINGLRRGVGYLRIAAEANPQWSDALKVYKSKKASSDKDAL